MAHDLGYLWEKCHRRWLDNPGDDVFEELSLKPTTDATKVLKLNSRHREKMLKSSEFFFSFLQKRVKTLESPFNNQRWWEKEEEKSGRRLFIFTKFYEKNSPPPSFLFGEFYIFGGGGTKIGLMWPQAQVLSKHSYEVAYLLLTQQPKVQFPAFPKYLQRKNYQCCWG